MFEMGCLYSPSYMISAEIAKKLSKQNMGENDLSDQELRDIAAYASHELERREDNSGRDDPGQDDPGRDDPAPTDEEGVG